MMAFALGLVFLVILLVAPRHGVVSKLVHRAALSFQILREDLLGLLFRADEFRQSGASAAPSVMLAEASGFHPLATRLALLSLKARGEITRAGEDYSLTASGHEAASQLVRSHRLWEAYLQKHLNLREDHLHAQAATLEHVTDSGMRADLAEALDQPRTDPHGRPIPARTNSAGQ